MADISRIYEIKVQGVEEGLQELALMSSQFDVLDNQWRELVKNLTGAQNVGDSTLVDTLKKKMIELDTQIKNLQKANSALTKEVQLQMNAERQAAETKLALEKANLANTRAEEIRLNIINKTNKAQTDNTDSTKKNTQATKDNSDAVEEEAEKYVTLAQRISELTKLREEAFLSGKNSINFDNQVLSLTEATEKIRAMKVDQNLLNDEIAVSKKLRDEVNIAEEGSLRLLTQQRKELELLISERKSSGTGTPINFEGQVLTLEQARDRLKQILELQEVEKKNQLGVTQEIVKQVNEYDKLVARRKELQNLTINAQRTGASEVSFEGNTFSIQESVKLVQQLKTEEQALIDQFRIEKNIHDQINIAQETSIANIKQQAAELKAIVDSRAQGRFSTVEFQGQTLSIDEARQTLANYQSQIIQYNEAQRARVQSENIVDNSMKQLAFETKQLTTITNQLTAANREAGLSLSPEDWKQYQIILQTIAPEIAQLSLAEVNAGRAAELLNQKIFANNAALREFKLSLSGSNTLVGDYTKGIIDAFKNLGLGDILKRERVDVQSELSALIAKINELKIQFNQALASGDAGLEKIEEDLKITAGLYTQLSTKARTLDNALAESGTIGNGAIKSIESGFKNLDKTIGSTLITYLGFQAAIQGVSTVIRVDKEISDSFADLQRILGTTKEQVDNIGNGLRELNTRTSITELSGFANIAARAGVAEDAIVGVVSAINKINLIAGKELGDNIDTAVTAIVKIINIFEGPGKVTEENVLRFGNALVYLANQGVATGEFLINFAERLSGIEGVTKISIQSVLGIAAAFEETGATSEIAATSITQILNRIGNDIQKYAALANGIRDPLKVTQEQVEEFRKTLRDDPAEALIQLAEGLKGAGVTLDEFGANFADLAARGVRVESTFQNLASRADFFREKIKIAKDGLSDFTQVTEGSIAKEETFGATVDKIGASLTKAFSSPTFLNSLKNIGDALLFFVKILTSIPFAVVITGITLISAGWAYYKGQVIAATLAEALNKEGTLSNLVAKAALRLGLISNTAATVANTAALQAEAVATTEAAVATTALNTALKFSPLGIILTIIGAAIPLVTVFASKMTEAAGSTNKFREAAEKANKSYDDLNKRVFELKNNILPLADRYDELTKKAEELGGQTKLTKEEHEELDSIIKTITAILPSAQTAQDEYGKVIAINTQRVRELTSAENERFQSVKNEAIKSNETLIQENNKALAVINQQIDQLNKTGKIVLRTEIVVGGEGFAPLEQHEREVLASQAQILEIKKRQNQLLEDNRIISTRNSEIRGDIQKIDREFPAPPTGTIPADLQYWINQYNDILAQIKTLDLIADKTTEQQKKLDLLLAKKREIAAIIKRLGGTVEEERTQSTGRVRVERDVLAEIETIRARDLAGENLRFSKIQEIRDASFSEEVEHINRVKAINDKADQSKIEHLTEVYNKTIALQKNANGVQLDLLKSDAIREQKEIAEAQLALSQRRVNTNKQLQALREKEFEEERRFQKKSLEAQVADINRAFEEIKNTEGIGFLELAVARRDADNKIFLQTVEHYNNLITIGKALGVDITTVQEEQNKAINNAIKLGLDDNRQVYDAYFKDIDRKFDIANAKIVDKFNELKNQVIQRKLPLSTEDELLGIIDKLQSIEQARIEFERASEIFNEKFIDFNFGRITEQEYLKFKNALDKAKLDLKEAIKSIKEDLSNLQSIQDLLRVSLIKVFNFNPKEGDNADAILKKIQLMKLLAETVSQSFDLAKQSLDDYFEAEKNRIEASKEANIRRLELEFEQRQARAQSQEEEDSLNRQLLAAKREEEKKAFEANKKIQIEQAKINFAIELANLAVIASSPGPANILTLGIAGAVLYAIQSAIAFARYQSTVNRIQSSQFTGAYGLSIGEGSDNETIRGGIVKGQPHSRGGNKFLFKGRIFEDEVDELNIIRTKNADPNKVYNVTGTQKQIASFLNEAGGGIKFAHGAIGKRMFDKGGNLIVDSWAEGGSILNLQAPINPASFLSNSSNPQIENSIKEVIGAVNTLGNQILEQSFQIKSVSDQTNRRIDRLKVENVVTETIKVNDDKIRVSNIGTI